MTRFNPSRRRTAALAFALTAALALALSAAPARAADSRPPLFAHTDQGPITVMHGDTREPLQLQETRREVRDFVARADTLIAAGADAATDRLEAALKDGRSLQQELDTKLVGTLYLEEAVRRLKRMRLSRVPVRDSEVVRRHAERYPERFDKAVVLRRGVDDLGVSYATLAACLELADFPNDPGPRTVNVGEDGALWTKVAGSPFALDIVRFRDQRMLVRSVVLGGTRSLSFKDKEQVLRLVLDTCI